MARRDTRKPTRCGTVPGLMSSCRRKIAVWARRVARTLWSALIATTAWRLPSGLEVYTQQSGRSIGPRIRSLHEEVPGEPIQQSTGSAPDRETVL